MVILCCWLARWQAKWIYLDPIVVVLMWLSQTIELCHWNSNNLLVVVIWDWRSIFFSKGKHDVDLQIVLDTRRNSKLTICFGPKSELRIKKILTITSLWYFLVDTNYSLQHCLQQTPKQFAYIVPPNWNGTWRQKWPLK